MFNSYIGRLVLIYSGIGFLIIGAIIVNTDYWLDRNLSSVNHEVFLCDFCPVMDSFEGGGVEALIKGLELRKAIHGLDYLLTDKGNAIAGTLNIHVVPQKGRFERRIASKIFGDSYILHAEFVALTPDLPEQKLADRKLRRLTGTLTYFYGGLLIITGFLATLFIIWRIHSKLKTINKSAQNILKQGDLSQRIPESGGNDEFDRLATNLNTMLASVENKIESIKNVSNNIAHDLRTPLTKLHNAVADADLAEPDKNRILHRIDGVIGTFNALLRIAKLDSGAARVIRENVEVKTLIHDVAEFLRPLAEAKSVRIDVKETEGEIPADKDLLFQAMINILENAIRHAPENGEVWLGASKGANDWIIFVRDNGGGVPDEQLSVITQPFVQLGPVEESLGTGLGLSLVQSIAEAHGGTLQLENREDGFIAALRLPHGIA